MFLAQTNLQLLAQLRGSGYPIEDLEAASSAYWLAAEVFTGKVRGSGKPFLCHLVGTAAATGSERPPVHVITAALCHGIAETGDFGDMAPGARDKMISGRLGSGAVALLARYTALQKERVTEIPAMLEKRPGEIPDEDRWSALIWVANEVDDEIDAGSRFRSNRPDRGERKAFCRRLTGHFRWNELEAILAAAYAGYDEADWAEPLAAPYTASVTFARREPKIRPSAIKQFYWSLSRQLGRGR